MTVADPSTYKIGGGDVLDVSVFQIQDLTRSVQVAANGTISLPLIGIVQAGGRTAQQVEGEIASKLRAKYVQSPQVGVYIREYNSQKVTVEGSVSRPGVIPLHGDMTLLQAVALAGDPDRTADLSNIVIFRTLNNQKQAGRFDVSAIRSGQSPDPALVSGDIIVVDQSFTRAIFRDFFPSALGTFVAGARFIPVP